MSGLIECLILLGGVPLGFAIGGFILIKIQTYNEQKTLTQEGQS